ncbi:MAG: anthranilate synthase component I [Magnetococcales bacterium]|nr:anthranilate synthase component I [Magnetococcales bacterium]MBF0323231.1 anthranilate synthase component I [Magnetococcales bacterium]
MAPRCASKGVGFLIQREGGVKGFDFDFFRGVIYGVKNANEFVSFAGGSFELSEQESPFLIHPSLAQFRVLAGRDKLVPVYREILADLDTPVSVFLKVAGKDPYSFLLESVQGGEKWGRFSMIGIRPLAIFKAFGQRVEIHRQGQASPHTIPCQDIMQALKEFMLGFQTTGLDLPFPFQGGAVGYLGYDVVRCFEKIPDENPDRLRLPDALFMVPETVVIFDNLSGKMNVVANVLITDPSDPETLYQRGVERIAAIVSTLRKPLPIPATPPMTHALREEAFVSEVTREQFESSVARAKEYIAAGDIMQVVLSQRLSIPYARSPLSLYRALRTTNPSPYLFLLQADDFALVGSSPEILVRQEGDVVTVRPIAGTRPRGATPKEDLELEQDLLADPKELAEHIMLVDLGRNDVGRVAVTGSVKVTEIKVIERYSHVMHIVSNVEGRLRPDLDSFSIIAATFPAGTVSGAPKIRAMEIIEELEPSRRGPYAGAVGYLTSRGFMDLALTIRTAVIKDSTLFIQAGAGIVADSDPAREYEETLNKARAIFRAVHMVQTDLE